jgi:ribosomal protein S18 acetylase RimI-like enzyme
LLEEIYASTRQEELAPVRWPEQQKRAFLHDQHRAQHRHYRETMPDASYDLILVDGRPVGRLYVERRPDEVHVIDIAFLPAYRGAGLGTQLLQSLLNEATAAGKAVRIYVEQFNRARRLYERLGFRQVAERGIYLLLEWRAPR